jgi:hypothetical protein
MDAQPLRANDSFPRHEFLITPTNRAGIDLVNVPASPGPIDHRPHSPGVKGHVIRRERNCTLDIRMGEVGILKSWVISSDEARLVIRDEDRKIHSEEYGGDDLQSRTDSLSLNIREELGNCS